MASAANWRLLPGGRGVECLGVQEPLGTPVSSLPPEIRPDLPVLTPQALHKVRAQGMVRRGLRKRERWIQDKGACWGV